MNYRIVISILCLCLLAACAPEAIPTPSSAAPTAYPAPATPQEAAQPKNATAYPAPNNPLPTQGSMARGMAFVDKSELVSSKTSPVQYSLKVSGSLPTPCNVLKYDVKKPDAQNRIQVDVYSQVQSDQMCAQVMQPFDTSIPLESLTSGKYSVVVNGSQVGELVVP
jgi:hypothetical protein